MRFNLALTFSYLFVSAAFADRRGRYHSSPLLGHRDAPEISPSKGLAGAAIGSSNGLFTFTSAIFNVPHVSGKNGDALAVMVSIDGGECDNNISLSLGVVCYVVDEKPPDGCFVWGGFLPDIPFTPEIRVSPGDSVRVTIEEFYANSGYAVIENLSTGEYKRRDFSHVSVTLCAGDVFWGISKINGVTPIPNWGTVNFTNVQATGPKGTYTPIMATNLFEMVQDNKLLANTKVDEAGSIIMRYL